MRGRAREGEKMFSEKYEQIKRKLIEIVILICGILAGYSYTLL